MSHGFDVTEAGLELTDPEEPPPGHPVIAKLYAAMQTLTR